MLAECALSSDGLGGSVVAAWVPEGAAGGQVEVVELEAGRLGTDCSAADGAECQVCVEG